MSARHRTWILAALVIATIVWLLLRAPPPKAVHGDVELGEPTVTAATPSTQAGSSDYYTSSTPGLN